MLKMQGLEITSQFLLMTHLHEGNPFARARKEHGMNRINRIIASAALMLAALPAAAAAQERVDPAEVFEQAWRVFNTNYPYFTHSGIDWDAIYRVYRPQVKAESSDDDLYRVLCSMLGHLNDGHVNLQNGRARFNAGVTHGMKMEDYSDPLVRTKYLKDKFEVRQDGNLVYGWLTPGIGYLRIAGWKEKDKVGGIVDSILAELKTAKGIIIDVRGNTGGNAFAAEAIANRFADRKRLYLKSYFKLGPAHDSLFPPRYVYVEPAGPIQFTGPVVLLQHRFSESASEQFVLAMRVLPHVTSIGEVTSGCFGAYYPDKLANGWSISMAWSYDTDQNDHCWVGTGVPPDLRVLNSREDIASEKDRVLEFAIDLVGKGGHFGKEAPGSLEDMRTSLYRRFLETAEKQGIKAAIAEFQHLRNAEADKVYFSSQECMNGARVLLETGKLDELAAIMELASGTWPDAISFPWVLAMVYTKQGQPDKAAAAYGKIAGREAYFPWDKSYVIEAKKFVSRK